MDSPSRPFETKPAIPSHLTGPFSLGVSTEACDKKERDSLYAQIQNSSQGLQAVNFDEPNEYPLKASTSANLDGSNSREKHQIVHSEIDIGGYNECSATRTPLAASRTQSPYIQHPTIDFDGLSWPSR
jgi:GTP cyclohydrolase I